MNPSISPSPSPLASPPECAGGPVPCLSRRQALKAAEDALKAAKDAFAKGDCQAATSAAADVAAKG